ncbi:MAG: T9SS type A sorting domain-containing protein [Chitinophagales bacterium]|nr:T9SS type A sorting domain-containing protein [Chitinophagales bacterium]
MGNHIKDTFDFTINTIYSSIETNSNSKDKFSIAPNPTNDKLNCSVTNAALNSTIQITTIEGRKVLTGIPATQNNFDIDVSALPAGIYFLQLSDERQRVVKKFVKQ